MPKKKIKDFTIGELMKICDHRWNGWRSCYGCPFKEHCPFDNLSDEDLDKEVEVPEE